ncbi:MAG TPA: glycosyltransferase 61 family protein [Candidatus Sulfotelmatobacter sp.]|jgi:tetratricopeptide (TPR) repeat protein|nr:glycosyltransferase 61 family protein [Candidatus Sulfotelmatobacter sp.]
MSHDIDQEPHAVSAGLANKPEEAPCSMDRVSTSKPLDHRTFNNLRVEAFKQPLMPVLPGGPVLPDPAFAHFRHKRADRPSDRFDQQASFNKYLEGEWAYVGPKYPHFGHIMAEMVHRIVPSKMFFPDIDKYLLVTTIDDDILGYEGLSLPYHEVLEFCEIDRGSVLVLNENTVVENLSICEQGSSLEGHPTPWYLDVLRDFSTRRLDQVHGSRSHPAKVYVSKSKIPHGGKILGERYIEELLIKEGFFVFYPEEAPFSSQMDVYRKAKELVFSEGSAFHGTELLGKNMLDRTFLLVRRKEASESFASILQPRSRQFEMFMDTFFLGTIFVNRETRVPHTEFAVSLLDIDRFVTFFRDHQLARLDDMDVRQYFDSAESDLRAYFSYQFLLGMLDTDAWRVGEVRLAFEKLRQRFLDGRVQVAPGPATQVAACDDADTIEKEALAAHNGKKWLEAAARWEVYRERFPNSENGFALGAVALIELGRFYEADALLRLAMEKFPDFSDVHSDYALVAHHRRDWAETVVRWEAFRTKFPQISIGYSLGATALVELGRHADADWLIRLGLQSIPDDVELLGKRRWLAELRTNRTGPRRDETNVKYRKKRIAFKRTKKL